MPGWVIFQPATPGQFPTGGDTVDRLVVIDNSSVDTRMRRVLELQNGVVAFALDELPGWVEQIRDAMLAP
jgi:hypothetical protein